MSKIDVSQWKEFKIGQIIQFKSSKHVYHASKLNIQKEPTSNEWYPYVVRSAFNNGIRGYVKLDKKDLNPANTISFAQDTAQFFFQTQPYYTGNKVKICSLKDDNVPLTMSKALFLISCMYKSFESFSYEASYTVPRLKRVQIKLPVDSSGNPDWHYMDEYIAKRAALAHKYVSELKSTKNQRTSLKISGWHEYKLSDLFDPEYTNGDNKPNRLLEDDDGHPLIGATSECFGCVGYYQTDTKVFPAKSLTWDRFGHCFVQLKSFQTMAHGNVMVLKPKVDHSYEALLFVASIINRISQMRDYGYGETLTLSEFKRSTIKLPALSDGTPDWATMRKRVAHLAALSHRDVTSLDPAELPIFMGDWQDFKVGQLFDIETGGDLVFRNLFEGEIPVVSHSMENNGVKGYYQRIERRKRYDHEITLALADRGTFFASSQAKDFYVATRVKALIFKDRSHINENIRVFLSSVINRLALRFADYSENATNRLPSSVIKLPVDINGHPDWQYMNNYVEFMKSIADRYVGSFQSIINNL